MTNWINRWEEGKIAWHKNTINSRLIEFIEYLNLKKNDIVFVPLCGKSLDILYLSAQGYKVIGVEISEIAVKAFFIENNINFSIEKQENFLKYSSENITIFVGNYFSLKSTHVVNVVAVYDRASLIALNAQKREKYVKHLYTIIPNFVRILLLTLDYPQEQMKGPPYSVNKEEVKRLYGKYSKVCQLQCFNDIKNEDKFLKAGVKFINKTAYCLQKE